MLIFFSILLGQTFKGVDEGVALALLVVGQVADLKQVLLASEIVNPADRARLLPAFTHQFQDKLLEWVFLVVLCFPAVNLVAEAL